MTAAQLEFRQIACLRGDRLLFENMSFTLNAGNAAIVRGANGAGKSSLLRIAAGLLKPWQGTVGSGGRIAWLSEQAALDSHLPLGRALAYWSKIDGREEKTATAALEAMDVAGLTEVPVRMLSTGQRRRAGLARVIASGAPIWVLDEPGNGLDSTTLARLEAIVADHRQGGGIALVATHQALGIDNAIAIDLDTLQ
jgi:heme exporter protein A